MWVILAIAFITFIAWFDENIIKSLGFFSIKKLFIGSILGLVLVYFVRFYSLAFNGIKSGYEKINISVDESAYLLGFSKRKTFMNIHVPFLRNSLLFIIILISLEIVRELPITLILRPFNFETFATTAYISASEDLLEAAAVPSLRQIQSLEQDLKVQLFERHARGLTLTENGEYVFKTAHEVISKLKEVETSLGDQKNKPTGKLTITTVRSFGTHWLTPMHKDIVQQVFMKFKKKIILVNLW